MEKKVQDQTSITDVVYIPKIDEDFTILRQSDPRNYTPDTSGYPVTNKEGRSPVQTANRKAPLQATRKGETRK